MSVREYIGARYVPLFADPLTWDATNTYEPLTVVLYQGNSYTSRQAVPANIDITNTTYWAQTGNYNAQIEQYRAEVQAFDGRIDAVETDLSSEETARQNADTALQTAITNETTARQNADTALQTALSNEATARENADALLATKTELQNAVSGLASETYVKNNSYKLVNRKILCIGDSLTRFNSITTWWPEYVNTYTGATMYNYAVPGSGYTRDSSFAAQVLTAAGASEINNNEITDVICMGGFNDYAATYAQVTTACLDVVNKIRENFTNARIHLGAMLHGTSPLDKGIGGATDTQRRSLLIGAIRNIASARGCAWIDGCWYWMVGRSEYDYGDGIHTNIDGQRAIAGYVISHLMGGSTSRFMDAVLSLSSSHPDFITDGECHVTATNGVIMITGRIVKSATAGTSGNHTVFTLPAWAWRGATLALTPAALIGGRVTGETQYMPRAFVDSGGNVVLQYMQGMGTLADTCFFNLVYPFGI